MDVDQMECFTATARWINTRERGLSAPGSHQVHSQVSVDYVTTTLIITETLVRCHSNLPVCNRLFCLVISLCAGRDLYQHSMVKRQGCKQTLLGAGKV